MSGDTRILQELPKDQRSREVKEKLTKHAKRRGIDPKLLVLLELEKAVEAMDAEPAGLISDFNTKEATA